jgi:hypothetical protein
VNGSNVNHHPLDSNIYTGPNYWGQVIGVHLSRSPGQSRAGSSLDAKGPPWSTRPWTVSCRARADREHRRGQR